MLLCIVRKRFVELYFTTALLRQMFHFLCNRRAIWFYHTFWNSWTGGTWREAFPGCGPPSPSPSTEARPARKCPSQVWSIVDMSEERVWQICQVARLNVGNTFADLSVCFNFVPTDFHSVWLYSNSAEANVQCGFRSFQKVCFTVPRYLWFHFD